MNITNVSNLPDAIVKAVTKDDYNRGDSDYTATELISPPRQLALKKKHKHEITEDVSDLLWRLYGKISHKILEDHNEIDLAETRFYDVIDGKKISAQIDTLSLEDGILSDYKFTTSWGFMEDKEPKDDWTAQLNIQHYLMKKNGYKINKLRIIGLLRDFRKSEAKKNPKYPQSPIVIQEIEMWTDEKTLEYIRDRIKQHEIAKAVLPRCSGSDRWAKSTCYAVIKEGGVRAINGGVKNTLEEAQALSSQTPGTVVETRPGKNVRCEDYCSVSEFCAQFKMMKNDKLKKEGN